MCQSQAQGGRRCYGHAAGQLQRAETALSEARALLPTPAQWDDTDPGQKAVRARYFRQADRVQRAQLAIAGTERGYLEIMEKADQIYDASKRLGRLERNEALIEAEWLRCVARAGQAGRSADEQQALERRERAAWAEERNHYVTVFATEDGVMYAITRRPDGTGSVTRETADEFYARKENEKREARAAERADRKARAARLSELRTPTAA